MINFDRASFEGLLEFTVTGADAVRLSRFFSLGIEPTRTDAGMTVTISPLDLDHDKQIGDKGEGTDDRGAKINELQRDIFELQFPHDGRS